MVAWSEKRPADGGYLSEDFLPDKEEMDYTYDGTYLLSSQSNTGVHTSVAQNHGVRCAGGHRQQSRVDLMTPVQ